MDRSVVEKRYAAARTEGHFITPGQSAIAELRKVKTLTSIDPTDLCSDCSWPNVCAGDAVCWHDERRIGGEVARYRRREKRGTLTGTVADVGPVSQATGRAHDVGTGETAHEWIDGIERMVDGAEQPIEIEVEEPLQPANQRLMDVLGVTVNVTDGSGSAPSSEEAKQEEPELIGEEEAVELRGRREPASSSSTSSRAGVGPGPKWTKETAIAAIQAWSAEHGHPPSSSHRGERTIPSGPTALRLFGSWATLIESAGFERPTRGTRYKGPTTKWTIEAMIAAIQAFAVEHGRPPRASEANGNRLLPPNSVAHLRCGSWADLIEAAGFERPKRGTRYKDSSGNPPAAVSETAAAGPDEQEPGGGAAADLPAPPPAGEEQIDQPPPLAAGASETLAPRHPLPEAPPRGEVRAALIGVLDSLRTLVDAVLPEES